MLTRKKLIYGLITLVVLFVLAEFTLFLPPFSPTNPPVSYEVAWDSPQTEALFNESCADCHSNETVWPWYSYVVPVAWLVTHDVQEGREKFNISTGLMPDEREEIEEEIDEGEMPPEAYLIMHPNATLTDEEKTLLVTGLENSLGASTGQSSEENEESGEGD